MKQGRSKFDMILAEAVQEGLSSISPSIPSVVFLYLQKGNLIQSCRIIDDPKAFEEGLKKVFGFGARVIEKKILEVLYIKVQVRKEIQGEFKFVEEVKKAQKLLDSTDLVVAETH